VGRGPAPGQGLSLSHGHAQGQGQGQGQGRDEGLLEAASLLNVGLKEWRERSLSIAMQRSRTVANSSPDIGLVRNPTLTSRSRAADKLLQAVRDASTKHRTQLIPGQDGLGQTVPGSTPTLAIDLPPKYYSSLSRAPHASLIHVIILYHQSLLRNGLTQEAEQIVSLLEGLQDAENADAAAAAAELQGIDLLLKDGLLKLYLRIQPYLPLVNSQVHVLPPLFLSYGFFLLGSNSSKISASIIGDAEVLLWYLRSVFL
jgi:hypothetical protein